MIKEVTTVVILVEMNMSANSTTTLCNEINSSVCILTIVGGAVSLLFISLSVVIIVLCTIAIRKKKARGEPDNYAWELYHYHPLYMYMHACNL